MGLWTRSEADLATKGSSTCDWVASGVSIDTRTLQKGDLFIALKAERDGHDFVAQAFSKGAAAAMVSRIPAGVNKDAPLLVVADVQTALERLGAAARERTKARIVAVTGSVGKTSTKDMLNLMLSRQGKTHASVASYNNHWGVPLTLARMPAESAFGIFEIGMNHPGEIAPLARQVRPHVAMITTVSEAHLEAFENIEGIAREKASIMEGLSKDGKAVLNGDIETSAILNEWADKNGCEQIWFGTGACFARLLNTQIEEEVTRVDVQIDNQALSFSLATVGQHFVKNALGALASVSALGADVARAADDLCLWQPGDGRGARKSVMTPYGAIEIIDDAYNANPASVSAALETLSKSKSKRRIAILGDMKELGPSEVDYHKRIASLGCMAKVDCVYTVGPLMKNLYNSLPNKKRGRHFK
ncbi:MAG: UDP-N-acetylmuramoyl-tripeptide--D-alanyl-D-alanine ligase, partial [Paracoccaceae bacterium]